MSSILEIVYCLQKPSSNSTKLDFVAMADSYGDLNGKQFCIENTRTSGKPQTGTLILTIFVKTKIMSPSYMRYTWNAICVNHSGFKRSSATTAWNGSGGGEPLTRADCCRKENVTKYFFEFQDDSWICKQVSNL